jgi:hypothetical protein
MTDPQSGTAITGTPQSPPAGGFRDPTRLTLWLKILLWALIGFGTIALISDLLELKLLNDLQAGVQLKEGEADANDARQRLIAIVHFVALIATIIVFAMWIYRANYNARQLGAAGMTFTPGWAVGWYFIPIANLWKPYQAMKEIWQASANPAHWQTQERGAILPWWWGLFLLSGIVSNAALRLSLAATTLPAIIMASMLNIVSDILNVAAAAVALGLVIQVFRMQMANRPSPALATAATGA